MNVARFGLIALLAMSATACATPDQSLGLDGQRTVFYNPYANPTQPRDDRTSEQFASCDQIERRQGCRNPGRGDITMIESRGTQALTLSEQRAIQRRNERRERRLRKKRNPEDN